MTDADARPLRRDKGMNKYCMILVGLIGTLDRSIGGNDSRVTFSAPARLSSKVRVVSLLPHRRASFSRRRWRRSRRFVRDYEGSPGVIKRWYRSSERTNHDGDVTCTRSLSRCLKDSSYSHPFYSSSSVSIRCALANCSVCPPFLSSPYLPEKLEPQSGHMGINNAVCKVRKGCAVVVICIHDYGLEKESDSSS